MIIKKNNEKEITKVFNKFMETSNIKKQFAEELEKIDNLSNPAEISMRTMALLHNFKNGTIAIESGGGKNGSI